MAENDTSKGMPEDVPVTTLSLVLITIFNMAPVVALLLGFVGIVDRTSSFVTALSLIAVRSLVDMTMVGAMATIQLIVRLFVKADTK